MIYLTFDTNIWIYSLDESWQIENNLDYLEPWIQNGEIKLLHPEIIFSEWEKHEYEQVKNRQKKLKDFFEMAEEILPSAFFEEYKDTNTQKKIIEDQLDRAKKVIFQSEKIPKYQEVIDRIIRDGINKKAPLHKKSSIADAIIVYSLIHYAKLNKGNTYYFISNNTVDFYQKTNKKSNIHDDLKQDFEDNNIKAYTTLNQLINTLKSIHQLKVDPDIQIKRKERIRNKIKEKVYNPEYENLFESDENQYIQNLDTFDFILSKTKPTNEQVIYILALVDSDDSYERDFFKRLEKQAWFYILKRKGMFSAKNNPAPVPSKGGGYIIPIWHPITYLKKISLQIKNSDSNIPPEELISIINEVCKSPVDNNHTWIDFINILSNLPNCKIPNTTLEFLPVWFTGNFDTILLSYKICEKLLPKFLPQNPTQEDILKEEIILKHLLSIKMEKLTEINTQGFDSSKYSTRIYLYALIKTIIDEKLSTKIAKHCSNEIITNIAKTIKDLQLNFPNGINPSFKVEDQSITLSVMINNENLHLSIIKESDGSRPFNQKSIAKYEYLSDNEIEEEIISFLKQYNIYEENKSNQKALLRTIYILKNGVNQPIRYDSIENLILGKKYGEKLEDELSFLFIELLNEKVKQQPEFGIELLRKISFDIFYRLPFFKRVALYIISNNWESCNTIFWELVQEDDPLGIFSNYYLEKDLYSLIHAHQLSYCEEENRIIQNIINNEPKQEFGIEIDSTTEMLWRLQWYSALRESPPFKDLYIKTSKTLGKDHTSFEDPIVHTTLVGSKSPLDLEEIIQSENKDIVELIQTFRPTDSWQEPSISGFTDAIKQAIKKDPQKFANELKVYTDTPIIYIYNITIGLQEAWKNHKDFDWESVLLFYRSYLLENKHNSKNKKLANDGWGTKPEWILGAIGDLLLEGMREDAHAFELALLPIAKEILINMVGQLKKTNEYQTSNMDPPTYYLNSTAGKTLRALLDYSLRRARNTKSEDNIPIWEQDIIELFESTLHKEIIDIFILIGVNARQFNYLNQDWTTDRISEFYNIDSLYWNAFFSSYIWGNQILTKDMYILLLPHFKRAFDEDILENKNNNTNYVKHIVSFYLRGFDNLENNGLINTFIIQAGANQILHLVEFILYNYNLINQLAYNNNNSLEELIIKLWGTIETKYDGTGDDIERDTFSRLSQLIMYVSVLNNTNTKRITSSACYITRYDHKISVIDNLIRLKDTGESFETASYVSRILESINFDSFISTLDIKKTIDLVNYLYLNEQKDAADKFCNKRAQLGDDFLNETYSKYQD